MFVIINYYYYYYYIIIIIIFRVGREYRIYSKGIGGKGKEGKKSCPKYDKVRIGKIFEKVYQIKGRISSLPSHLIHENCCWKWKPKRLIIWKQISSHIIEPKVRKWKSWWKRKYLDIRILILRQVIKSSSKRHSSKSILFRLYSS